MRDFNFHSGFRLDFITTSLKSTCDYSNEKLIVWQEKIFICFDLTALCKEKRISYYKAENLFVIVTFH